MKTAEVHSALLADTLAKMFSIRRFVQPWQFLLKSEPQFDVEQLVAGSKYSISGSMKTKSRMLPKQGERPRFEDRDELAESTDLELTTNWYFVPHFCFDQVSVGAVIGENTDSSHILFDHEVTLRFTRYARDDLTGDFFVLAVDPEANTVEVLYIKPNNNTDRLRAFIRFDYSDFMDVCKTSTLEYIDLARMQDAVLKSNIIQEFRLCPSCRTLPGQCSCRLSLRVPTQFMDLECNASNMSAHVGNFIGTSFHFIRGAGPLELTEHLTQCNLHGGPFTAETSRLYSWAVQNRLSECSVIPPPPLPRPSMDPPSPSVISGHSVENFPTIDDSVVYVGETIGFPQAQVVNPTLISNNGTISGTSEQSAELPGNEAIAASLPIDSYGASQVLPITEVFAGNSVSLPVAPAAPAPARPVHVGSASASPPQRHALRGAVEKASPARRPGRGRRKKQPIVRPLHPVAIAPLGVSPGQTSLYPRSGMPKEEWEEKGFSSKEEWQNMRKIIKSRESAARSNEKRKLRTLEKRKQMARANKV